MFKYLSPLLPSIAFNAFLGQITIFIASYFGKSQNIAEVSALGRLSQIFVFLATFNSVIVAPYSAKCDASLRSRRYWQLLEMGF